MSGGPLRYLALGDSYTIGEGVDPGLRWPLQLAHALRDEGIPLDDPTIIATTGWTTDELSAAIDAVEPLGTFDFVSLLIGVNNQYRGHDLDNYRDEFGTLLERAIGFAAGRADRVLVLSIPDWGVTPFAAGSGRDTALIASELDAFNAAAQAICDARGVTFVDITPTSREHGGDADMLADDGLHPSGRMYTQWSRAAQPVARRLLSASGHPPVDRVPRPFDARIAKQIARQFLPERPLGNRYDYYYTLSKLRTDPLYPGVLAALRGQHAPLMDLGCGLGLLAHALRGDGQQMPYVGVDVDAPKIARAQRIAGRAGLAETRFDVVDLSQGYPAHSGNVAILDVLQFLTRDQQAVLLDAAIAMVAPGGMLVMRAALDDGSARIRRTRFADRFAALVRWMPSPPVHYPLVEDLRAHLSNGGLDARIEPFYGNTPFNNWLVVARRPG